MRGIFKLFRRFRSDEGGAFLALFGVIGIVLIATSGAVVDYVSVEQARTRAQVALDAAVLALHAEIYNGNIDAAKKEAIRDVAEQLLVERLSAGEKWAICAGANSPRPCVNVETPIIDVAKGQFGLRANIDVPLYFVALVGVPHMQAALYSEATRGSMNIEVAVALDTTGSMGGKKIKDLQDATKELVDAVVQDVQTYAYTKVALVPYSMGVNVGSTYAEKVRGPINESTKPIKAVANWSTDTRQIVKATKANPVVITTSGSHGYKTGDTIAIQGVGGMGQINNRDYKITKKSDTEFSLNNVDGGRYGNYTSGGTASKCINPDCEVIITVSAHGYKNGEAVYVTDVGGMGHLNNKGYIVKNANANQMTLGGSDGYGSGAYTSGGKIWCANYGCKYYHFPTKAGGYNTFEISTCVSERTTNAYNEQPPSTTLLGLNYAANGNACLDETIQPLTSNKSTLKNLAGQLSAGGSTAGHIGIAWAWYMISPEFAYLWPTDSQPAPYDAPNLRKVVVLMTDGEFNTAYCNGIIAGNSGGGSGGDTDHINCDATNGTAFEQAEAICAEMKKKVTVYTVGFDVANLQGAKNIMANCATDAAHAFTADTGTDLKAVFKQIGENIAALRLSK